MVTQFLTAIALLPVELLAYQFQWSALQIDQDSSIDILEIERFSFECRKVIGFAFTTLRDWLKRFAPLFHPIRSKTKSNCAILPSLCVSYVQ